MADKPDQDPSIEEILASIRQIISDDDEKPAASPETRQEAESPHAFAQDETSDMPDFSALVGKDDTPPLSEQQDEDEDILDLTEEADPEKDPLAGMDDEFFSAENDDTPPSIEIDLREPEEDAELPSFDMPVPDLDSIVPEPEMPDFSALMSNNDTDDTDSATDFEALLTDTAAGAAMGAFTKLASQIAIEREEASRPGNVTLEDIVRELLKPMLREWLNQNLPPLIEKLVQKELQRLAEKALND